MQRDLRIGVGEDRAATVEDADRHPSTLVDEGLELCGEVAPKVVGRRGRHGHSRAILAAGTTTSAASPTRATTSAAGAAAV